MAAMLRSRPLVALFALAAALALAVAPSSVVGARRYAAPSLRRLALFRTRLISGRIASSAGARRRALTVDVEARGLEIVPGAEAAVWDVDGLVDGSAYEVRVSYPAVVSEVEQGAAKGSERGREREREREREGWGPEKGREGGSGVAQGRRGRETQGRHSGTGVLGTERGRERGWYSERRGGGRESGLGTLRGAGSGVVHGEG